MDFSSAHKELVAILQRDVDFHGVGRAHAEPAGLHVEHVLEFAVGEVHIDWCAGGQFELLRAADVIDVPTAKRVAGVAAWSSAQPDAAIADFVSTVMALVASDPRSAAAAALLKGHFTAATAQGASASDALKSTFVAACLAPSSTSIGL